MYSTPFPHLQPKLPPGYPRPLRQVYPWKSKEKRMTIAAGFVVRDGILLCADTLYTDGYTKEYRDKIFPWPKKGAAVCFALAGSAHVGGHAIRQCQAALSRSPRKQL